jgi:2-iminobutanoate/2-iminopropanoate deaminase
LGITLSRLILEKIMKRSGSYVLLAATLLLTPSSAWAQGGYGGRGSGLGPARFEPNAPKLPGPELQGPLDSALARVVLKLSDEQAARYSQAYDSFMVATRPQRDSAGVAIGKMNDKLDLGDRAAAMFYVERVQELGKFLKDRQDKFQSNLRRWLSGDQVKAYRAWREGEDQAAERKRREDALRWQEAAFRGGFAPRTSAPGEPKTIVATPHGVADPALGSQAIRTGGTLYVAGQLGVDSMGTLAGAGLRPQTERAFANLGAILQAAGATPRDVIALTIYVVNLRPADLATIREVGATYFGPNAAIATVLGVAALGREGALISIGATAVMSAAPSGRER